jgi:serine/threonine protein kinase
MTLRVRVTQSNILIKPDGSPALMDHGLHDVTSRISHITTAGVCKPCRWMAPEVLDPPESAGDERPMSICTPQSDVYAMGMTFLEVITRRPPFSNRRYDTTVILAVIAGALPLRPDISAMSDDAWDLMQDCWKFNPEQRLTVPGVERRVQLIFHMEMARRVMSHGL